MFTRLLLPLDGSAEAGVALPPARALAAATGAGVRLLRVVPEDRPGDAASAEEYLAAVARELAGGGVATATAVRQGPPAREIAAEADQDGCDLIVMATHGRSGLGRAILGSVADGVVATSPVPVVLLRPGGHRVGAIRRLLVPVDGAPGGALAAGLALGLARATGAQITLLQVAVPLASYALATGYDGGMFYPDPSWDEETRQAAGRYVDRLAARLAGAGVVARGRLEEAPIGSPSAVVAETIGRVAAELDADLIVMSTHALTGPVRTVLGSVADAVVRGSHRAVLLVRHGMRLPRLTATDRPLEGVAAGRPFDARR